MWRSTLARAAVVVLGLLSTHVVSADVLHTEGLSSCMPDSVVQIQELKLTIDRTTREVTFDVHGLSSKTQNVTGMVTISAYGHQFYTTNFDPCSPDYYVEQLCPIPSGKFDATGKQQLTSDFVNEIPSIAFSVPDLDGQAKVELKSKDDRQNVTCITTRFNNGKTTHVPAVSYAAAGVAGAAFTMSGVSAIGASGASHATSVSSGAGFAVVMGWFHSMATNGMLSVDYPPIYRSFTKNFAFSTGLMSWEQMQSSIDSFRRSTGGNLTRDSYSLLMDSKLSSSEMSSSNTPSKMKRTFNSLAATTDIVRRDNQESSGGSPSIFSVSGMKAFSQELSVPASNTFMTILSVLAIVIAVIVVGILLFKAILEAWALYGNFPQKLSNFRRDYWGIIARTITNLILILYGIWVLYCVYQFTAGDSWAAKVLAAVTLVLFTAILAFFTFRIWQLARKYRETEGDVSGLYEDKETWHHYSLFYESYKKDYWWLFIPVIVYSFAKGCIIAAGNGHGLVQSAGQLILEALMLILLLWHRPYVAKSAQWINITIQVIRLLSIACVLVFVEELGFSQTTKTVTGVVIMGIQSALTAVLSILIAVNAIIGCIRENPHKRRRKEAEKLNLDLEKLPPRDSRDSLTLVQSSSSKQDYYYSKPDSSHHTTAKPCGEDLYLSSPGYRSTERLIESESVDAHSDRRSVSPESRGSIHIHNRNDSPERCKAGQVHTYELAR